MSAAITDLITQATTSSRPTPTQVTTIRVGGGTTLACNALTGWPTATAVHFCTYKINTSGAKIAGSQIDMKGIVSGTNITNVTIKAGTDVGNAVGDIVEAAPTAAWANDVVSWGTAQHSQLGAHVGVTTDTLTATGIINASTVSSLQDASVALATYRVDSTFDYVVSGGVWSGDAYASTRNASMTAIVCWVNGQRLSVGAVTARSFTASKDTYIDILNTAGVGSLVYTEVTNNAASPALAANSIRIGIIVTGATNIAAATSVNQGQEDRVLPIASSIAYSVTDSLGNLIYPRDPQRRKLGYKQLVVGTTTASTSFADVTGLAAVVNVPTAGRSVEVSFKAQLANTLATSFWVIGLVRDGTVVDQMYYNQTTAGYNYPLNWTFTDPQPGSGTHTYKIQFATSAGSTLTLGAGTAGSTPVTAGPAYIKVQQA